MRRGQLSDLLKSLVIFDEKGSVAPVAYSIEDYVGTRAVGTDLELPDNATPGTILRAFRGATVVLSLRDGDKVEGRIASVSAREVPTEKGALTVEVRQHSGREWTAKRGVKRCAIVSLCQCGAAKQIRGGAGKRAPVCLPRNSTMARGNVTLRFNGKGKRQARAGYLLEMPTWKTSYRLVLDDNKKPFLQGWAIVENPTDADWNGVQLSLVAGRPISFIQNLAIPVYVARPVVETEIPNASFTPQTFGDGLGVPADLERIARIQAQNGYNFEGGVRRESNGPGGGPQGVPGSGGGFGGRADNTPITAPAQKERWRRATR